MDVFLPVKRIFQIGFFPVIFSLRATGVPLLQIISLSFCREVLFLLCLFPLLKGHPLFFVSHWRIFIHVKRCQFLTV